MEERIHQLVDVNIEDIKELFKPFDKEIIINSFKYKTEGLNNTNIDVYTSKGEFFLKIYAGNSDEVEIASYKYLKDVINIPKVYYYDKSKTVLPYSYAIIEYLDGITLKDYIRKTRCYLSEYAYEIGKTLACLQKKSYMACGLLDNKLEVYKKLPNIKDEILNRLEIDASNYFKKETISAIKFFITKNEKDLEILNDYICLVHDDLHYGNIMIYKQSVYFIDFDFAYSGSRYCDIGHLFRRKDEDIESLINKEIYNQFENGYNSSSNKRLPDNWLKMSLIADINSELKLLNNHKNISKEWVNDIENDILNNISNFHKVEK